MKYRELTNKADLVELNIKDVVQYFGESFRPKIKLLHRKVGHSIKNLVYLLSITEHYEDKTKPLDLLINETPAHNPFCGNQFANFDCKSFYEQQKFLYAAEKRGILQRERVEELIKFNLCFGTSSKGRGVMIRLGEITMAYPLIML